MQSSLLKRGKIRLEQLGTTMANARIIVPKSNFFMLLPPYLVFIWKWPFSWLVVSIWGLLMNRPEGLGIQEALNNI